MSSQQEDASREDNAGQTPPPAKKPRATDAGGENVEEEEAKVTTAIATVTNRSEFELELIRLPFGIFHYVSDIGYFRWKPYATASSSSDEGAAVKTIEEVASGKEILDQIDVSGVPHQMVVPVDELNRRLPAAFLQGLAKQEYSSNYPHGQIDVACLHVAARYRGVNLGADVDFCFGGSTLGMLANKDTAVADPHFFATKVPGLKESGGGGSSSNRALILVANRKQYTRDRSFFSFQFERFVTGRQLDDNLKSPFELYEHMQLMHIGRDEDDSFTVLFRAECDAVERVGGGGDGLLHPVEIKANNPAYWDNRLVFQMISNGSPTFCHGIKSHGVLERVQLKSLSELGSELLHTDNSSRSGHAICGGGGGGGGCVSKDGISAKTLQNNILEGMERLKSEIEPYEEGQVVHVSFAGDGKMLLTDADVPNDTANNEQQQNFSIRREQCALLPAEKVVKELLIS